jgi:hypothetical protein
VAGSPAVFDWSRHYPYYDYAEVNMIEMGKDGLKRGLVGLVTTKWGDFFNENFRENIYYGLAVNGQASWSPDQSVVPQIRDAFSYHFYGTMNPEVVQCIGILSKQNEPLPTFPNGMFNRYWLDPFVRDIKYADIEMAMKFIEEGLDVIDRLEALRSNNHISLNDDNIDYMIFAARMAIHYGVKILISQAAYDPKEILGAEFVKSFLKLPEGDPIFEGFKWLKEDIEDQRVEYNELWKRFAVPEGLEYPDKRFEWLAWHYEKTIEDLFNGRKPHAHQLKSEWIWRSGLRYNPDWGNNQWYYFTKSFIISTKKTVKKATIQGIAASHLKISLNGNYIGEVLSRMALSQLPPANSIQWFDVTKELKSENILCIDGINWTRGIGSINIILHIEYDDGSFEDIITDKSWKWTPIKPLEWPLNTPEKAKKINFKSVRSYGKPPGAWQGPITEPDWEKGWKSSASFTLGARNFIETSIPTQIGEKIFKPLFWAVPLGAKLLKTDIFGFREQ